MLKLTTILFSLVLSLSLWAQSHVVFCDRDTMKDENGRVIHRFSFTRECQEALREVQLYQGRFCAQYHLFDIYFGQVYSFNFQSECQAALRESSPYFALFCHRGNVIDRTGRNIRSFNFQSDCQESIAQVSVYGQFCARHIMASAFGGDIFRFRWERDCLVALNQAKRYRGFFCGDSDIYNARGIRVSSHSSQRSCEAALDQFFP
jgi:hypothetical protein